MDKCACVVLNYNDWETTLSFINNVKDYESIGNLIVVDNCSTDNSYNELLVAVSDKTLVIRSDRNGGYGYGNNYGVNYACNLGYQYCLIANPDVGFSDLLLKKMLITMRQQSDAAVVAATQKDSKGNVIDDFAWKIPTVNGYIFSGTRLAKFYNNKYSFSSLIDGCESVDCVPGAMLLIDIQHFKEVGGYDENMFLFCEETALGSKLKRAKFGTYLLTGNFYKHNHSISINKSISSQITQRKLIYKSRRYVMESYLGATKFQLLMAIIVHAVKINNMRIKGLLGM